MGGFARRSSYWNAFAKKFPSKPALRLDGGSVFSVGVAEAPIQNRWVLEGTYRSRLDALNLSLWDLPVWQEMAAIAAAGQIKKEHLQVPLVSANVVPKVPGFPKVERFVVRTLSLDGGGRIRIGITGVLIDHEEKINRAEFEVKDPAAALREVIGEMQGRADYRIVLADMDLGRAISTAVTVPGINLLLVAHNYAALTDAQQVAGALILTPVNEGRMISEVRVAIDATTSKASVETRLVPLDHTVPDDPVMGELVRKAQAEVDSFVKK